MTEPQILLADPSWFPIAFDLKADTLTLLKTNREALSRAAFLDQRFYDQTPQIQTLRLSQAIAADNPAPAIDWIFHTAFCCSTLMARALDVPGMSLTLKEPDILMQLANARRMMAQNGNSQQQIQSLEHLILNLLGRRFNTDETILIKPTNSANPVIDLAMARGESCLFMVAPLEAFLISVIKKGEACRSFVRTQFNIFSLDPDGLSKIPQRQAMTFTDLQVAALIWHHQVQHMTLSAGRTAAQVKAMDGTQLPNSPEPYLAAAAKFFELGWHENIPQQQANSSNFTQNAKFSAQSYDAAMRASEADAIRHSHAEAIETTLEWANSLNLGGPHRMLPAPSLL